MHVHDHCAILFLIVQMLRLFSLTISKLTPIMLNELDYGTFLVFGFCCLIMAFWAWLCLPETAGFGLEEIGLLFEKDVILRALQDAPGGRIFIGSRRAAPVAKLPSVSTIRVEDLEEAVRRESRSEDSSDSKLGSQTKAVAGASSR
jgi:hypothetical protein